MILQKISSKVELLGELSLKRSPCPYRWSSKAYRWCRYREIITRDAIGLMGIDFEDNGRPIPDASNFSSVRHDDGEIVSLVDVDFTEYRKKTCFLPSAKDPRNGLCPDRRASLP